MTVRANTHQTQAGFDGSQQDQVYNLLGEKHDKKIKHNAKHCITTSTKNLSC